mgnify:CR=1 FL=1
MSAKLINGLPLCFFAICTVASTLRSLIHIFAPDGGAGSIAGIEVSGPQALNLIAIFAQWGVSQLLLAVLGWVVIFRLRSLLSLMLAIQLVEMALRILVGHLKPIAVVSPPPGAYASWVLLPLTAVFLILELRTHCLQKSSGQPAMRTGL